MADGVGALDVVLGPAKAVGRYFSMVSGLTSLIPVLFLVVLFTSGAPNARPSGGAFLEATSDVGLVQVFFLAFATLSLGVVLHPLQFGLTQVLEGYWGTSALARRAMCRSSLAHLDRSYRLEDALAKATRTLKPLDTKIGTINDALAQQAADTPETYRDTLIQRQLYRARIASEVDSQQATRALGRYPAVLDVMPTMLGNVLRRYERAAGQPFGLDAVTALPYLGLVAEASHREYLEDMRSSMDLAVRSVLAWTLCTVSGSFLLWRHDIWLLVPAASSLLALLSYRGAVASAAHYGNAITLVVTLNRRVLYRSLGLAEPEDIVAERAQNDSLGQVLRGSAAYLAYQTEGSGSASRSRPRVTRVSARLPGRVLARVDRLIASIRPTRVR